MTDIKSKKLQSHFTCQASQILNINLPPQYIQLQSRNCLLFQLVFLQDFREHPLPFAANQCNSLPAKDSIPLCSSSPEGWFSRSNVGSTSGRRSNPNGLKYAYGSQLDCQSVFELEKYKAIWAQLSVGC